MSLLHDYLAYTSYLSDEYLLTILCWKRLSWSMRTFNFVEQISIPSFGIITIGLSGCSDPGFCENSWLEPLSCQGRIIIGQFRVFHRSLNSVLTRYGRLQVSELHLWLFSCLAVCAYFDLYLDEASKSEVVFGPLCRYAYITNCPHFGLSISGKTRLDSSIRDPVLRSPSAYVMFLLVFLRSCNLTLLDSRL